MKFLIIFTLCIIFNAKKRTIAMDIKNFPVEKQTLFTPPLEDIAQALNTGLTKNFQEVKVEVVDSPDLTQQPFTLASKGFGGNTKIIELGGVPYLLPLVDRSRLYDLKDIAKITGADPAFVIGAGAGPHPYAGVNCEGIFNLNVVNGSVENHSRISKVNQQDGSPIQEILPNTESRCALLGNLFISEGIPSKVLKVYAKKRIGNDDFIASIRKTLVDTYKDKLVGLGGVFLVKEGKAKQHVMSDFSKTPINTEEQLNTWLQFYNMSAPLIAVGTLVNGDGGLDLRVQHFHSFSHHGEAGHYHIDVTPDTVEYLGYFNVGEEIYRVDRPKVTHQFGRD